METVIVTLKHAKAKKLLQDLEEMDVIEIQDSSYLSKKPATDKIGNLKFAITTPMSESSIDEQLSQLRNEWERNT